MEDHTLKNVNNYWNTKFYFYLEKSAFQNCNLYLNLINFVNTCINKTSLAT